MSDNKESQVSSQVQAWWDRITAAYDGLPQPAKVLLGTFGVTVAAVAVWFAVAPMMKDYTVLYADLDHDDAGAIVEELKKAKADFRLTGDGSTIEVPAEDARELRLQLATAGMPRGGRMGFEDFQNMRLGATEFEQHVTYRTAMEGELARTIATVRDIHSARVHLVLPKKSVFSSRNEPASASVVVRLKPGRQVDPDKVRGIVYLVASAVPALSPDRVTLVTTDGVTLHRPKGNGDDGDELEVSQDQLTRTRNYEALLEERTRSMLERMLGAGHVDVRVRAELDTAKVERKSDHYDPKNTALRSERLLIEGAGAGDLPADTVAGVPGAESNLPTAEGVEGEPVAAAEEATGGRRRSHTRNWEVDHVQERRTSVTQSVKRLAVAVIVDGVETTVEGETTVEPRSAEELTKLTQLVKSAVGFDEARGDQLSLESVSFYNEPEPTVEGPLPVLPIPEKLQRWVPLAKYVGIGLASLIALLVFRSKWRKAVKERAKRRPKPVAVTSSTAETKAIDGTQEIAPKVLREWRREALDRATADPATAALVMRHWLGTAGQHDEQEEAA